MTGWSWKRTPPEFPPPGSTISILSEGSTCRSNTDAHRAIVCYNIANDPVPYVEKECWCASYLVPLFQFLIEHWSDSFPWWRLCEQSVLNNMKHTLIVTPIILRYYRLFGGAWVCDLMRRSRQSSCRWLVLSGPRCRVPLGPEHTRRLTATRKAFIWKHKRDWQHYVKLEVKDCNWHKAQHNDLLCGCYYTTVLVHISTVCENTICFFLSRNYPTLWSQHIYCSHTPSL